MSERNCFVISTIGKEDSDERKLADEKFDLVYKPVCEELHYDIKRADKETSPNLITRGIIARIIKSEMIIADVSDSNANVFYELAVRNAVKKPVVVVKNVGQTLPFDIYDKRAVSIDMGNNRQWFEAKAKLKEYIKNAQSDPASASESILDDFSFQIGSKIEGGVNELSIQVKDLRDELHSLIELSKSDRTKVSETVKPVGIPVSPQSITASGLNMSGNPIPSGAQNWIPTQDDLRESITKTLARNCPKCGRESIGFVSGQCMVCSMTKNCSKCGKEFFSLGVVGSECLACSMTKKCPKCGQEYFSVVGGPCPHCSLGRLV